MTELSFPARLSLAGMIAATGGAVALAIATRAPELLHYSGVFREVAPFLRLAMGGALIAGLLVAPGFGRAGGWGWVCAMLSLAAATALGAALAWSLLPVEWVIDLFFGGLQHHPMPFENYLPQAFLAMVIVCAFILSHHYVLGAWVMAGVVLHLCARGWRNG